MYVCMHVIMHVCARGTLRGESEKQVTANGNHVLRAIHLINRSNVALDIVLSSDRYTAYVLFTTCVLFTQCVLSTECVLCTVCVPLYSMRSLYRM